MIKTVIFDLDNTLMDWKEEYIFALENTVKRLNLNYDKDTISKIDKALVLYEKNNTSYTKEKFIEFVNNVCGTKLNLDFMDILIEEQCKCYEEFTGEKLETIKYLSGKYKLICISNWFTYTQIKRLENAKIAQYFDIITGGDEHELKPSLKAFDIIENKKECVMIGDSIKNDIEPAIELGMQAILITKKPAPKDLRYRKISKLEELKEML